MFSLLCVAFSVFAAVALSNPTHVAYSHDMADNSTVAGSFTKSLMNDTSVCNYNGTQWTGKIPVTHENSLFYWYYESEANPATDPLVIFLAGGPGMSSTGNAFVSMGPCRVLDTGNGSKTNEWSWTGFSNMLFIDYIAGTGFSKEADDIAAFLPQSYEDMTTDIKYFLRTFVNTAFPELAGRTLHIGGESFGGAMALSLGYALADASTAGPQPDLQLRSVIVGSGLIDVEFLYNMRYEVLCAGETTYVNQTACDNIAAFTPACEVAARKCRFDNTVEVCLEAGTVCAQIDASYDLTLGGLNPFRLGTTCDFIPTCYDIDEHIQDFFNSAPVQSALGFTTNSTVDFEIVDTVIAANLSAGQIYRTRMHALNYLLNDTDVRVLTYTGPLDGQIPATGNEMALALATWPGSTKYRAADFENFQYRSDGRWIQGGHIKTYSHLTSINFYDAGHFAPIDQPEAVYWTLKDWVADTSVANSSTLRFF